MYEDNKDECLRLLHEAYRDFIIAIVESLTEDEIDELHARYLMLYKKDQGKDHGNK